jgi:TonB family protein
LESADCRRLALSNSDERKGNMSSTNHRKNLLMIPGGILILVLMAAAAIKSGHLPGFIDLYGFIFVLVGGIALVMISFSGGEIRRALMDAAGSPGSDQVKRLSALFWEALGRGFFMLGGMHSVLSIIVRFEAMKTEEMAGAQAIIYSMSRSLLSAFYGILLAVICLIPCWKLMGSSRTLPPSAEPSETRLRYGSVIGYILFFSVLVLTIPGISKAMLWNTIPSIIYWPSLLVVVGGALVLMLFIGGVNSGPPLSACFASMGLIGFLIAFIQMLFGIGSAKIASVAYAVVFVLSSCFAALLGMSLVGAPLEDRAVRTGRVAAPSAFSRISWYCFPVLTLVLVPLVIVIITTPMPMPKYPQVIEVFAPAQEQPTRYEARAPQSEPMNFLDANIQKTHLIYKVNPTLPEEAKREGIQGGTVKLAVVINEEGFVYGATGNAGNNPILEKAAIPAVKRWRFIPFLIYRANMPVAIETTVTVNFFSLNK